jgi:hypothetical protein
MPDTQKLMNEAMSHLGAALAQSLESDDQVIMQHVRDAYVLLGGRLEWLSSQSEKSATESALAFLSDNV